MSGWARPLSWLCLVLVLFAIVPGLTATAAQDDDANVLTIALEAEPRLLDPLIDDTVVFHTLQRLVYEPLVNLAADTAEPAPLLAESWTVSDDGTEYTFTLQQGVTFHDGTPFNAEAVKYSIDRVKGVNVFAAPLIKSVEDVEVVDDQTVTMHLGAADPTILQALHWVFMVSPTAFQENEQDGDWAKAWAAENMVGTGPYTLEQWDRGAQLVFTRYDDYWRGWEDGQFETIISRYVPERATQRLLVEQGDVDIAFHLTEDDLQALRDNSEVTVFEYAGLKAGHIGFNTTKGLTADPLIRQAIAYAFPRDDMIAALQDIGLPANGPYPETLIGSFGGELPGYQYDLDRARELLAEAGHADGGFSLELVYYNGWPWEELAATLLQASLQQLNITVDLVGSEWPPMYERLLKPETAPDMYGFGSAAWLIDPSAAFGPHFSCASRGTGGYNWMHYCNPELDRLVDQARVTSDPEERLQLYQEATRIVAEDAPWFTTHIEKSAWATGNGIQGMYSNPVWASENIVDFYSLSKA